MVKNKLLKAYSKNLVDRAMKESTFFLLIRNLFRKPATDLSFDKIEFLCVNGFPLIK